MSQINVTKAADRPTAQPSALKAAWDRVYRSAMLFGVFATGIRVGANLLLLPLLLSKLPSSDLALWWVFVALGGFANLADFGFGATIARVYSFLWAGAEDFEAEGLRAPAQTREPNLARIRQLTATAGYFYWALSLVATLILAGVGTAFLLKPMAAVQDPRWAWLAWAGFVLSIGYNLGTGRWMLACQGLGRMRELQAAYTWSGLAYVLCAAAGLLADWGLPALVVATFLKGLIARAYCRRVYYAAVPKTAGLPLRPDMDILKRLWPNASKFGVLSIGAFFLANGSVLICSQFLGDQVTASFGLTAQIGTFLLNFAGLWLTVKWPELTMLRTQGRLEEMSVLFARRLALAMGTFVILAGCVILTGNWLLEWKGTQTRLLPTACLIFYFGYLMQQLFYVQFGNLAYTENVVPFFKISIFTGLAMLTLSFIMTRTLGLWGLLVAPLIAESAYSSWFTIRRGFQGQPLSARRLLKAGLSGHF